MRAFVSVVLLAIVGVGTVYGQTGMRHGMGIHGGGMHGGGMHGGGGMHAAGGTQVSMLRHAYVRQHGIPAQYADKTNPLTPSAADLEAGQKLYAQQCAQCHGPTGRGDGAGQALTPPPADLTVAAKLPMATDAYLYWTVAEGGVPVGSAMPPFKSVLTETEIWRLISYLRSL